MKTVRIILAAIALAPLALACSAAPPDDATGSTEDALGRVGVGGSSGTFGPVSPPYPTFPPANATYCPSINTNCSVKTFAPDPSTDSPYTSVGCTALFLYMNGQAGAVVSGAYLTLCDDTPAAHAAFGAGLGSNVCDACLPAAPAGKFYSVQSEISYFPNCQTGCPAGTIGTAPGGTVVLHGGSSGGGVVGKQ